ncbi:MAG: S41 family peptidase [Pirellulaceae bacterium]
MFRSCVLQLILLTLCAAAPSPTALIAQESSSDDAAKAEIEQMLTRFRQSAAQADSKAYFDCIAPDAILFGTDEAERWTVETHRQFVQPYFDRDIGWSRTIRDRRVYLGADQQFGWFEEISERVEGVPMRTTGVVRKIDGQWKIVQYNTAFAIPNEIVADVSELIRETESNTDEDETSDDEPLLSDEQRQQTRESFDYVWEKVRDAYWDENLGGVDWQSARDELRPQLERARTMPEARQVLDDLVSRMQVSHFSIIPQHAYEVLGTDGERIERRGETGMDVRIIDGQVVVVAVRADTPAAKAGVQPGWIVTGVNDIDVPARLTEVQQELEGNAHARTILASAANGRLRGPVGEEITFSFLNGDDQSEQHTIALETQRGKAVQFGHLPEFRVWVERETLDNGIGYFRFNAFIYPPLVMGEFNRFMADHMDAPGVIIDVRANGGGMGEIGVGMIGWLMSGKEKQSLGKVVLRNDELKMIARPRATTYGGPVVVLIDEMSVSAAEFFAQGIKQATDGRLIGTRTAGAVLGSQIERLPNGDGFQFAAANFFAADTGETLEGIGVTPHETVPPNRVALLAGEDPAIKAAVRWISSQPDNSQIESNGD